MPSARPKPGLLVGLGLLAPLWWTWLASQATYRIYVLNGSPSHPTRALLWWSVFVPSLVLGVAAGLVVTLLLRPSPLKGWIIFVGSVLFGTVIESVLAHAPPWTYLASLFASVGNLVFWLGSLVCPAVAAVRRGA